MEKMDKNYVVGMLENIGCFYILKNTRPLFCVRISKKSDEKLDTLSEVFNWLKENEGIEYRVYEEANCYSFKVVRIESLKKLIVFMEENCKIPKKNQKEAIEIVREKTMRV